MRTEDQLRYEVLEWMNGWFSSKEIPFVYDNFFYIEAMVISNGRKYAETYLYMTGQDGLDRCRNWNELMQITKKSRTTVDGDVSRFVRAFVFLAKNLIKSKNKLDVNIASGVSSGRYSFDNYKRLPVRKVGTYLMVLNDYLSLPIKKTRIKSDYEENLEIEVKYLREVLKFQEEQNRLVTKKASDFIRSLNVMEFVGDPWKKGDLTLDGVGAYETTHRN